jgi:DNA-binding SARP family transcriptional activator
VKAGAVHPTLVLVLRVRLFGPLTLELDGVPLRVPTGATARSVLAWLLLHPGLHMRAHVAARFWPDVLDGAARGSLRTALWEIRRAVGGENRPPWLHASRERIGVPRDLPRWVDVEEFERHRESGRTEDLEAALELARSPLLSDLVDDWVLNAATTSTTAWPRSRWGSPDGPRRGRLDDGDRVESAGGASCSPR